jgi:hypothetical protein
MTHDIGSMPVATSFVDEDTNFNARLDRLGTHCRILQSKRRFGEYDIYSTDCPTISKIRDRRFVLVSSVWGLPLQESSITRVWRQR